MKSQKWKESLTIGNDRRKVSGLNKLYEKIKKFSYFDKTSVNETVPSYLIKLLIIHRTSILYNMYDRVNYLSFPMVISDILYYLLLMLTESFCSMLEWDKIFHLMHRQSPSI